MMDYEIGILAELHARILAREPKAKFNLTTSRNSKGNG